MLVLLAIGINFSGTPYALKGCVNDARNVANFIRADQSVLMTDDLPRSSPLYPTRENIFREFKRLVNAVSPSDFFYFHFSGHGFFISRNNTGALTNQGGTISAGLKECILVQGTEPKNITASNTICHAEFNDLFSLVPPGLRVFGMIDACDSGTVFDLAYNVRLLQHDKCPDFCPLPGKNGNAMEFYLGRNDQRQCYRGKIVLLVSVKTNGVAWDTVDDKRRPCGAFTNVFLKMLAKYGHTLTYLEMLYLSHNRVGNAFAQDPQLSCCDLEMLNRHFLT